MTQTKIKYCTSSLRLSEYDYGQNGAYFITICTQNRDPFFGEILNDTMHLSDIGEIAQKFWKEIPSYFPFVTLGEWVIMPNHTHGVIFIGKLDAQVGRPHGLVIGRMPRLGIPTALKDAQVGRPHRLGVPHGLGVSALLHWKSGNLGVIINQYKRACTIESRKISVQFAWQSRFYDRIIRDEAELNRISEYIIFNPQNWEKDDYF